MARVVTDDQHYKDIANVLREALDTDNTFRPDKMSGGIKSAMSAQFAAGEAFGREGESAKCASKHFAQVATGDGSRKLSFYIPFNPDVLYLLSNEPYLRLTQDRVASVELDFTALGQLAGKVYVSSGTGAYAGVLRVPATVNDMFSRGEDGQASIQNVTCSYSLNGSVVTRPSYFQSGVQYMVIACKIELDPLKVRIENSVRMLPDTPCSAYYQRVKVEAAFTTAEWTKLTAEKPNCTFNLI